MLPRNPPPSASNQWLCAFAALIFILAFFVAWRPEWNGTQLAWLALALYTAPVALADIFIFKVYRRDSAGLAHWQAPRPLNLPRVATKLLGLYAIFAVMATFYALLPEYDDTLYVTFFQHVKTVLPFLLGGAVPYFAFVDTRMSEQEDGYYALGRALTGKGMREHRKTIGQLVLGWAVKCFFLPMMYSYLLTSVVAIHTRQVAALAQGHFMPWYFFTYDFLYLIDLLAATIGYLYTFRLTDTHIRSTEPTMLGWVVAIVCYQPIWNVVYQHYIRYEDTLVWDVWLKDAPTVRLLWGCAILGTVFVYAWASVAFGLRFSNLTYRGLISGGPYRFTKHPAYLAKNISWWLVSTPFLLNGPFKQTMQQLLGIVLVNILYYFRARTEERHLMQYPEYREYAAWMAEHGRITAYFTKAGRFVTSRL